MKNRVASPIQAIGIVGKITGQMVSSTIQKLMVLLVEKKVRILVERSTAGASLLPAEQVADFDQIGKESQVVMVVGGDGTMLHAVHGLACYDIPLIGINVGRLGFMTDFATQSITHLIDLLFSHELVSENRMLLEGTLWQKQSHERLTSLAMNEIVFDRGNSGHIIELKIEVNQELLCVLRADGAIISTPTGSTAYALSANGPILHPSVHGIVVVPLCPHSLSNRPIIIDGGSEITLTLLSKMPARVYCDGRIAWTAEPLDELHIVLSKHQARLLHPPEYSYFSILRQKLSWNAFPSSDNK